MRGVLARELLVATALLLAACASTRPPASPEKTCVLVGGPRSPVVVKVYDGYPYAQPGGNRLFMGSLNYGERQLIESPTGRIWYSYAWHELDSWKEGSEVPCRDGAAIELPL